MSIMQNMPVFGNFVGDIGPEGSDRIAFSSKDLQPVFVELFFSSFFLGIKVESLFGHGNDSHNSTGVEISSIFLQHMPAQDVSAISPACHYLPEIHRARRP